MLFLSLNITFHFEYCRLGQAPSHPHDVKENVIHQTRRPSSIAQWRSSDTHLPTVGAFSGAQASAWGPTTGLQLHSPIPSKLWCTVFWHLSIIARMNIFSKLCKLCHVKLWHDTTLTQLDMGLTLAHFSQLIYWYNIRIQKNDIKKY